MCFDIDLMEVTVWPLHIVQKWLGKSDNPDAWLKITAVLFMNGRFNINWPTMLIKEKASIWTGQLFKLSKVVAMKNI